ncbi:TIR domain-containing protein [Hyphomonas sp.]|uniref:toll/interleukin-1 receptor domain-containing protein n=1 Tax=Hyphomonas sp. TaxID=87 RepID=UPI001D442A21|nr:TIR domain-containing protein [Hyphomonas sp.]MBU3921545.1 TIR domain-containing protein [Alphaproteobacteria bacterium]MBU4061085.1 TIR domain-containing protein [Alphaproteobacteria bacterium]MBU4162809.1 TIR domain-containing protein [Alphaproteobacteria bacterium]
MGQETVAETEVAAPGREDTRTRVFLSYSRRDSGLVTRVAEGLGAAGFLADFDQAAHDPHNVTAGISAEDEWWKRLQEMIASADVMVFLVSPDSAQSAVCDEEIAYARALGKRIIAALARPVDFARAPPRLSALNVRIDFSEGGPGFDAGLADLVSALEMNVGWHREGRKYYARVQEWDTAGRTKSRLLREGAVEEAERWALARPRNEPEPGELFLAWVAASRAQIKRDAAVRAFWRRVTAVFVLTTLVATVAGAWFVVNGQRNLGRSESLMLARTAEQLHGRGDYIRALQLAILASRESFLSPSTDEAKAAFAKNAQALAHVASMRQAFPDGRSADPVIARAYPALGGTRLVTANPHDSLFVWDAATGVQLGETLTLDSEQGSLQELLAPDGAHVIAWNGAGAYVISLQDGARLPAALGIEAEDAAPVLIHAGLSEDGQRLVTGLNDGTVRTYEVATGRKLAEFSGRAQPLAKAALTADGASVLIVRLGEALVADAATGAVVAGPFDPEGGQYWDGFISPDGSRILLRRNTGDFASELGRRAEDFSAPLQLETESIELWNGETDARIMRAAYPDIVERAVFMEPRGRIATVSMMGGVQLWDSDTGAAVGGLMRTEGWWGSVDLAPQDEAFMARTYVGGVQVWDTLTGAPKLDASPDAPGEEEGWIHTAKFPGTDDFLAWNGQRIVRLTPQEGRLVETPLLINYPGYLSHVDVSPDGRRALTWDGEGQVFLWEMEFAQSLIGPLPHDNFSVAPQFIGDGSRFLTIEGDEARIWSAQPVKAISYTGATDIGAPFGAKLSPDGTRQLLWNASGRAVLRDTSTGAQVGGELLLGPPETFGAVFDAGSPRLAIWFEGVVQLLDTGTGENGETLLEHATSITEAQFALDGRRLVTLQYDQTVTVWNTETMEPVGAPMQTDRLNLPVLPVGGRMIVWNGGNGQLVDLETGAQIGAPMEVWTQAEAQAEEFGVAFSYVDVSADESRIAVWNNKRIGFWSSVDGSALWPVFVPDAAILTAALAPDGTRAALLLDAPRQGAALFDLETGVLQKDVLAHPTFAVQAEFSPDGRTLATVANDAMLRVWDVDTGSLKADPVPMGAPEAEVRFSGDGRRMLVIVEGGIARVFDTATVAELAMWSGRFAIGDAAWQQDGGKLMMSEPEGRLTEMDIGWAQRTGASAEDIAAACAAKLAGTPDAGGVPFVRRLDGDATFAAPILRGREGEDVCTPPPVAWWERAAGMVFGWAFR